MQKEETINEFQKSQTIRLVDVFIIGPLLVFVGIKYFRTLPVVLSVSLIVIGVATVLYNGNNYLKNVNQVV